ncbi:acyl-CoA desaturase [Actinomycetospora endophytica]|uniref:Acyl-CoA desaturase n=1 Tax=Actinomycetospora endophytica TaxID=2291215 RepID=A0ABS8PIK2_9PSEU|nr:acyl-CoA desaturase [Actinomycetospora endophytica]MCD2198108.1 acyl-CoA desaturase [Actinomycetospora endophytica]
MTEIHAPGAAFSDLTALIKQAGLLDRRRGAYALVFVRNALLAAVALAAFVMLGASWWQLLTAVFLGLVTTQLAFIGHDAGHRQIFTGRRANDVVGYLHGVLVGMSYDSWVTQHNAHHAHPNHADADPDIDIPVLAFSVDQAATRRGPARWIVAHQAVMFVPLLLLEGWSLHLTAARTALAGQVRRPALELGLLTLGALGYGVAVFTVLTPLQGLAFVVVHQGVWGLCMGLVFAPNHKGMPIVPPGTRLDHLQKQVLTARNLPGGRLNDFLFGGLNHQVEHHLFPRMPRPNLRHARVVVEAFCREHGLPYTETGIRSSYVQILRHLHDVSAPLRGPRPAGTPPTG